MGEWKKLAHVIYQCKYHIVWTPKYRYRILEGKIAQFVERKIRVVSEWKHAEILELNVMTDHVHLVVELPPKLSVSEYMGIVKGKSAIALFRNSRELKKRPYWGNHFWSRGYCVTTIGLDEEKIRKYVKYQEEKERLEDDIERQQGLF
jgi:putative transposase